MVEQKQGEREISDRATLWTSAQVNDALTEAGVLISGFAADLHFTGVHIDSRVTSPGDLFIALAGDPGSRFQVSSRSDRDGHEFVAAAATQGATAAMVQEVGSAHETLPRVLVTDTYDALWALGSAAASRYRGPKIAITGSSGKTTLKAMLQTVFNGHASAGSFNNHIGVPLSLANAPVSGEPLVIEIGTSHAGEIEPLAKMVEPTLAVVLNVGFAHAENFASHDDLYEEKTSIFKSLLNKSNAISEVSLEWPAGLSFGTESRADVYLHAMRGDLAQFSVCGRQVQGKVPGGGRHRAVTLCAGLACCHVLDYDLEPILNLPAEVIPHGRGNEIYVGDRTIVDDSYNANPSSMRQAIETFLTRPEEEKTLVVGEMLELGGRAMQAHEDVAQRLTGHNVVLVGPGFAASAKAHGFRWVARADQELLDEVGHASPPGSAIFVKGSNRVFWQVDFVAKLQSWFVS